LGPNINDLDLDKYPKLYSMVLAGHKMTKAEMACLVKARNLKTLTLGHAPEGLEINADVLTMVKTFSELECVWLCKKELADDDLLVFTDLKNLKWLYIEGSNWIAGGETSKYGLTDKAAQYFKKMPALQSLEIKGDTELSDKFVSEIATSMNLSSFSLSSNKISDVSIDRLGQMKSLREIELSSKQFTAIGTASLQCTTLDLATVNEKIVVMRAQSKKNKLGLSKINGDQKTVPDHAKSKEDK